MKKIETFIFVGLERNPKNVDKYLNMCIECMHNKNYVLENTVLSSSESSVFVALTFGPVK